MKNVLLQYCAHTIAIKKATMERCAVVIFEPYFFKLVLCCRLVKIYTLSLFCAAKVVIIIGI